MNLQHNLNNLPVISDYDDLVNFNNSLPSSFQPLNIESVSYAKNIIIANGDSIGIDRFLYNYITSPYRLTGNIVRLKEYDFSKLSLLLHPREFFEEFEAYINNLLLFGKTRLKLWEFYIKIERDDIILTRYNNHQAEEIFIPYFITRIEELTSNRSNVRKVVIQEGSKLTYIAREAFVGCSKLKEINLPDSITWLGDGCFAGTALESIQLSPHLNRLYSCIFKGCKNLTNVVLPDNITKISFDCFHKTPLRSIVLPAHLKDLDYCVFKDCTLLSHVTFNNELKEIGAGAFENCKSLQEIKLPESLLYIDLEAFAGCSSLTEVVIPNGLDGIGKRAFKECTNLRKVVIGTGLKLIYPEAFINCRKLKEIIIPESVEEICLHAFSYTAVEELVLPKNVITSSYKMRDVDFPPTPLTSLEIVKETIAVGCKNLKSVKFV